MIDLHKQPSENEEQYIWRLGRAKESGELDMDWTALAKVFNDELRTKDDEYRDESAYRKPFQQALRFYEAGVFKDLTSEAYAGLLREEQRKCIMEKQKLRDEKNEYTKWLREQARDELICEKIQEAAASLQPIKVPDEIHPNRADAEAVFCFADAHYGTEFVIKGLFGEALNEYSPEIFERRMWDILDRLFEFIDEKHIDHLRVLSLGDELDGILRVSQLMKLRYGVVESAVKYSEFICAWLTKLTERVKVTFYATQGNHTELRLLGEPKGTFQKENMSFVINAFIKERMRSNPNFEFVQNESGLIFDTVCGYNILGIHGEVKNMETALHQFTNSYGVMIDILVGGHKHHLNVESVGRGREVVGCPSIIGVDDYSMSLGKTSDAGALIFVVEKGNGIVEQRYLKVK